jgi:hypothetical protein
MPNESERPIPVVDTGETQASTYCRHLLSKGMYITGEMNPRDANLGVGDGHCWCGQTQNAFGPDGGLVERKLCITGRKCHAELM